MDTLRMVLRALATISTYTRVITSKWGRNIRRMVRDGLEGQSITRMALRCNMTIDSD